MIYDLRDMENFEKDYTAEGGDLVFNFCKYANHPGKVKTFAYLEDDDEGVRQVLTSDAVVPQQKEVDEDNQLTTTYISNQICEDDKYWSFSTHFICDENITG